MWQTSNTGPLISDREAAYLQRAALQHLEAAVVEVALVQTLRPVDGTAWDEQVRFRRRVLQLADDLMGGTGRTTAAMLSSIATALRRPDQWVPVEELSVTGEMIDDMASGLGIVLDIRSTRTGVLIRSPLPEIVDGRRVSAAPPLRDLRSEG